MADDESPELDRNAPLRAEVVQFASLTQPQIALWRSIQRSDPVFDTPFQAPEFAMAVADARDDLRVAVLFKGETCCGFFPFHEVRRRVAKPMAGPISDYQGPLVLPTLTFTAEELLRACRIRAFDFNHVPARLSAFAEHASEFSSSPRMRLAATMTEYVAGLDKKQRHEVKNIDRRFRKLEREAGAVSFALDDGDPASWDWLVATKSSALQRAGAKGNFTDGWIGRTYARLREIRGPEFAPLLSTLRVGDALIAAHFGLRSGRVLCWWHTTYAEAWRQYGPGLGLLWSVAAKAPSEGIGVIDLGRGQQDYKLAVANEHIALCEGSIALPGTFASGVRAFHRATCRLANRLPLGRYADLPGRALGRLVATVRLPPAR